MKCSLAALLIVVLFCSCDPMRRVTVLNKTAKDVVMTWKLKEDSIKVSPLFISNTDEVVFTVKPTPHHNKMNMSFGTGNWNATALNDLVDDLEWFEIKSATFSIRLTQPNEIREYLAQHRVGITKRRIKISL